MYETCFSGLKNTALLRGATKNRVWFTKPGEQSLHCKGVFNESKKGSPPTADNPSGSCSALFGLGVSIGDSDNNMSSCFSSTEESSHFLMLSWVIVNLEINCPKGVLIINCAINSKFFFILKTTKIKKLIKVLKIKLSSDTHKVSEEKIFSLGDLLTPCMLNSKECA